MQPRIVPIGSLATIQIACLSKNVDLIQAAVTCVFALEFGCSKYLLRSLAIPSVSSKDATLMIHALGLSDMLSSGPGKLDSAKSFCIKKAKALDIAPIFPFQNIFKTKIDFYRRQSYANPAKVGMSAKFDLSALIQSMTVTPESPSVQADVKVKEKARPKRCEMSGCKTKLMLTDQVCRCTGYYCMQHRHSEIHSCSFDFKGTGQIALEKQLVKVEASKVARI